MNSTWQILLCLTYGWTVVALIPGHNLSHHADVQGPKDIIRTDKMRWKWNFLNLVTFAVSNFPEIIEQDTLYMRTMWNRGHPIAMQFLFESVIFFGSQFFFLYLSIPKYLLCICAPQLVAKVGIISINLYQHDGCPPPIEDNKYNFSRNFVDPVLNWFTCNNGYHTIHHLQPGTH